jgi:hypothetical protein
MKNFFDRFGDFINLIGRFLNEKSSKLAVIFRRKISARVPIFLYELTGIDQMPRISC